MLQPIMTKIAGRFQVTVPPEIRNLFDLQEGDLLQWDFDEPTGQIHLQPKRAQLLTPLVTGLVNKVRAEMAKEEAAAEKTAAVAKTKHRMVARAGAE